MRGNPRMLSLLLFMSAAETQGRFFTNTSCCSKVILISGQRRSEWVVGIFCDRLRTAFFITEMIDKGGFLWKIIQRKK